MSVIVVSYLVLVGIATGTTLLGAWPLAILFGVIAALLAWRFELRWCVDRLTKAPPHEIPRHPVEIHRRRQSK